MNPSVYNPKRKPGRFRIGDRVRITRGFTGAEAVILEDHGNLGPLKQRVYTLLVKMDGMEEFIIDYPEDEMEPSPNEESGSKAAGQDAGSASAE
jgi:hypothetical protein